MNGDTGISDADLVRYLDGELDGDTARAVEDRLAAEPDLARRLETIRRRSAGLSGMLSAIDPATVRVQASERAIGPRVQAARMPARWWRVPTGLRAAAAVVLVLTVALAVPPARAWVLERVQVVAGALGIGEAAQPNGDGSDAGARDAEVAFGFPVQTGAFEVRTQAAKGVLVIRRGAGREAWITIRGAPDAQPLVQPGVLTLDGIGNDETVYELEVPGQVTAVRVRTGEGDGILHRVPTAGEALRIDLGDD